MPSRIEPCVLNQMYSQRYGTPPIAHATGGLVDSIIDATPGRIAQGIATGFLFEAPTSESLWRALVRAQEAFSNPVTWRSLQRAGMNRPFGWAHRVGEYLALYRRLVDDA